MLAGEILLIVTGGLAYPKIKQSANCKIERNNSALRQLNLFSVPKTRYVQ
ncbi:hypothetical protein NPIL_413901, partial [Nephila pilipes]